MSLETEITKLTAAIEKLNANLEVALNTPAVTPEQPAVTPEQPAAAPEQPATPSLTQDDLRRLCMAKVKEDRAFKDTLKEFLNSAYGVVKTSDVPDDKVAEAYARIEQGNLK